MNLLANRYQLGDKLGEGGMGAVYRAVDRLTGDQIALKQVTFKADELMATRVDSSASEDEGENFRMALVREFRILATLHHPNIISVQDFGFDPDLNPFFTMHYLEQARPILEAGINSPPETRLHYLIQTLQALSYLHRRGILHRDLKSSNVLVVGDRVQVLDFGLSVEAADSKTITAGTMTYMSPELLMRKPATPASDLYAVGMLAFQLFSGQYPFPYRSLSELYTFILTKDIDFDILETTPAIVEVIRKLLAKNPKQRFNSAELALAALYEAIGWSLPPETSDIRESFITAAQFVGREVELTRLGEALQATTRGEGQFWLVGGESGVGKSRLLEELRIQALTQNVWVLRGMEPHEGGLLYQLWRDPLRRLVLNAEVSDGDAVTLGDLIPDLDRLLERPLPTDAPTGARQERILATLGNLLTQQQQPILLILEDLQWSLESLTLLKQIIPLMLDLPILVVGTYRDDERPSLPQELPEAQVMKLERLPKDKIAQLSASILGKAGNDPDLISFLQKETEGNIFFLVEVIRALAEEVGRLSKISHLTLPERISAGGIQTVVQRRLEQVPKHVMPFLTLAAVGGRRLDLPLLRQVTQRNDLQAWLNTLANVVVLEVQDEFWQFSHDKLREGVLAQLEPAQRQLLHQRVAIGLEEIYPNNPDKVFALVAHWSAAGNETRERHYLNLAIPQALSANGYGEVIKMAGRALHLTAPDDPQTMRLFRWLGDAYTRLSDYQPALEAYEQSLALANHFQDAQGAAECLRQMASLVWEQGHYALSRRYAQECLDIARQLENQELIAASINQLAASAWFQGEYALSEGYYEESLNLSRQNHHLAGMAVALNNLAMVQAEFGDYLGARTSLEESLAIKRKLADQRRIAITLTNLGMVAGRLGEYNTAKSYLEQAMHIERKIGNRAGLGKSMEYFADILQHEGDHSAAKALHIQSVELRRRIGERPGIVYSLIALAFNHLLLQEYDKAKSDLSEALVLANQMQVWPRVVEIMIGFAWLKLLEGQPQAAAEWLGMSVNHPVMTQDIYHNRVMRLLELLRADLGTPALNAALEQGKTLDFEAELQTILDDIS